MPLTMPMLNADMLRFLNGPKDLSQILQRRHFYQKMLALEKLVLKFISLSFCLQPGYKIGLQH